MLCLAFLGEWEDIFLMRVDPRTVGEGLCWATEIGAGAEAEGGKVISGTRSGTGDGYVAWS